MCDRGWREWELHIYMYVVCKQMCGSVVHLASVKVVIQTMVNSSFVNKQFDIRARKTPAHNGTPSMLYGISVEHVEHQTAHSAIYMYRTIPVDEQVEGILTVCHNVLL